MSLKLMKSRKFLIHSSATNFWVQMESPYIHFPQTFLYVTVATLTYLKSTKQFRRCKTISFRQRTRKQMVDWWITLSSHLRSKIRWKSFFIRKSCNRFCRLSFCLMRGYISMWSKCINHDYCYFIIHWRYWCNWL